MSSYSKADTEFLRVQSEYMTTLNKSELHDFDLQHTPLHKETGCSVRFIEYLH